MLKKFSIWTVLPIFIFIYLFIFSPVGNLAKIFHLKR